jgi:hypothetical protein
MVERLLPVPIDLNEVPPPSAHTVVEEQNLGTFLIRLFGKGG